jgi:choline-glycine betaine transporter
VNNEPSIAIKQGQVLAMKVTVTRYGARHWAVYYNGQLLAVTVYKKGALAVQEALESQCRSSAR